MKLRAETMNKGKPLNNGLLIEYLDPKAVLQKGWKVKATLKCRKPEVRNGLVLAVVLNEKTAVNVSGRRVYDYFYVRHIMEKENFNSFELFTLLEEVCGGAIIKTELLDF